MSRQFLFLTTIVISFSCKLFGQITIPNAGFEQFNDASSTKTRFWKAEGDNFSCVMDPNTSYKGKYSIKVSSTTEGNHFFNEEFPFDSDGLKKYRIKCAIKTKNLKGTVQLGARVFDNEGGTFTKTLLTLTENANQDWTIREGIFVVDKTASKLRVFGNLNGSGEAWFDEIAIEEIDPPKTGPSVEVALYVHEYFDIVYENSVISDKNFIADLKAKTMYLCADSIDKNDCLAILRYYTTPMLKDGHSFFTAQQDWQKMRQEGWHPGTGETHTDLPTGNLLKDNIALISIPMFISSDDKLMHDYADKGQDIIAKFDQQHVKGYIIDLSKNGGGNSLPMIAAVGPLIGNGICGYSFSGNGSMKTRIYKDGAVGWDTSLTFQKSNPYKLNNKNKPIAVIYSGETGSSGEVTATAFIPLPNSKSFGQSTSGATTRVDNFEMSDGSFLNLASGTNADRNKNRYDGPIKPDIETESTETAMTEAIKWILEESE